MGGQRIPGWITTGVIVLGIADIEIVLCDGSSTIHVSTLVLLCGSLSLPASRLSRHASLQAATKGSSGHCLQ